MHTVSLESPDTDTVLRLPNSVYVIHNTEISQKFKNIGTLF